MYVQVNGSGSIQFRFSPIPVPSGSIQFRFRPVRFNGSGCESRASCKYNSPTISGMSIRAMLWMCEVLPPILKDIIYILAGLDPA